MRDKPLNHIREDNEGLAYECARLDRECKELRQHLEQAQARVAELESCVDDGASVWGDYLCTGGGSPVAHGKFVRAAKAFIAKAQRLLQQADEAEQAGGEK